MDKAAMISMLLYPSDHDWKERLMPFDEPVALLLGGSRGGWKIEGDKLQLFKAGVARPAEIPTADFDARSFLELVRKAIKQAGW